MNQIIKNGVSAMTIALLLTDCSDPAKPADQVSQALNNMLEAEKHATVAA